MNRKSLIRSFIVVTVVQLVTLVGEHLSSMYPLWTGKPAILAIVPLNLRSLFRGNYVYLGYNIAHLSAKCYTKTLKLNSRGGYVLAIT